MVHADHVVFFENLHENVAGKDFIRDLHQNNSGDQAHPLHITDFRLDELGVYLQQVE